MPPTTKLSIKQLKQSEETTIQNWVNLKNNNNFRLVSLRFVSFHFASFRSKKKPIDHRYITCHILWVLHRIFYLYKIRATCSARIHCIQFDSFIDWFMFSFTFLFCMFLHLEILTCITCIMKCSIYVYLKFPFIFMFWLYNYLCRANIWFFLFLFSF